VDDDNDIREKNKVQFMLEEKYKEKHGGEGEDDDGGGIEEKATMMKRISRR
jgi:hypothetical protein